jgi:hypothetical protein
MNFQELMQRMVELDTPVEERAVGGQPGINRLTGKPMAPTAPEPDHLAEPPERAPADPNAPNLLANKTRMPNPPATPQEQPKEGNAFGGALDAARDSGQDEFEVDGKTFKVKEDDVDECGMPGMANMPSGMMGMPKQQDNVNMNVSMSGSGAGGIRDLMSILKNIENNGEQDGEHDIDMHDPEVIIKKMTPPSLNPIMSQEEFANEPDELYQGVDSVTGTGDDIHSNQGDHRQRQAGLPIAQPQMESLIERLTSLYTEVKLR